MDDFKQHQDTGATHLHYHVHSSEVALSIVRPWDGNRPPESRVLTACLRTRAHESPVLISQVRGEADWRVLVVLSKLADLKDIDVAKKYQLS